MKKQNYSNHIRLSPLYHYVTYFLLAVLFAGSGYYLYQNKDSELLSPALFIVSTIALTSVAYHCRLFALKAQDRAIRAEENLRYFILSGKKMDSSVSLRQIIALRFASDEEFVQLVEKTIRENLTPRQIKKEIKDWRGDYHRV